VERIVKSGVGWRLGWDPAAAQFQGLVGTDDWALELTGAEFDDFCRLLEHLATTVEQLSHELMDEEAIACEVESDLLWLEAEGYPHRYKLHLILQTGRRGEGCWSAEAVPHLLQAIRSLTVS
jgi:hypothetical protein